MNLIIALLLPALCPVEGVAPQQDRIDRVILKKGAPVTGQIRKESVRGVEVSRRGGTTKIMPKNIIRIEYFDMPPAYKGIFTALEEARYTTVLSALSRSEEQADEMRKAKDPRRRRLAPRKFWFKPAIAYYRALCLKACFLTLSFSNEVLCVSASLASASPIRKLLKPTEKVASS